MAHGPAGHIVVLVAVENQSTPATELDVLLNGQLVADQVQRSATFQRYRGKPQWLQQPPPRIDQSTGAGFDPSGSWVATPRPLARYQGRPQWQQHLPQMDVSTSASFDPPDLPATPLPRGQARPSRAPYQQYIPRIDVSEPALSADAMPTPLPRGQARAGRPQWQQFRPVIDQSTGPAFDPSGMYLPGNRAQFRPLARPWWQQYRIPMDASTSTAFDPPDLPIQITPRPPLRPTIPQRQQYRPTLDVSEASFDLPEQNVPRPPLRTNRVPWMQYRPQVAPDRGIRPLMHTAAYDSSDQTVSYTTATINSIGPQAILFVGLDGNSGTGPNVTVTGCGLTWTQEITDTQAVRRVTMFSGVGDASFPGALTLTLVDAGSGTSTVGMDWAVIGLQGADPSDLVVQASSITASTGTSAGITLLAFLDSLNRPFAYTRHRQAEDTVPATNWTELSDVQGGLPQNAAETQWRTDLADPNMTATWGTSVQNLSIAAEIRVLGVAADVLPPFYTPSRGQTRPPRPAWQQYRPTIDVSEPPLDFAATPPLPEPRGQFRYTGRPQWQQRSPLIDQSVTAPDLDVPYIRHRPPRPHRLPHRGPRHQYRAIIDQSVTVPNAAGECDAFASVAAIYRAVVEFIDGGMRAWATADAVMAGEVAVSIGTGAAVSLDRVIASSVEIE